MTVGSRLRARVSFDPHELPPRMTSDLKRLLAWAVIAGLAIYVLFFGGAWLGLYLTDLRIVTVAAAAGLLAGWALAMRSNPAWRPRSVLLPAILASLASLAISTVFSRYPRISLEYLGYAVVLAALYLLLVRLLADPFFRQRIMALASALFVAVVAGYIFLVVRHWVDWWSAIGVLAVPPLRPNYESLVYGTPSTVFTVVAMLAVPTIATVLRWTGHGRTAAVAVVFLVGIVALLTGSRAGWVAVTIASALTLALAVADRDVRASLIAVASPRVRSLIAVTALFGLVVAVLLGPSILRRADDGGESTRLLFTRIALELFTESPAVGTGPGSWVIERVSHTRPDELDEYIPHAHNVYAQTLGELGLVGAAAGLFVAFCVARLCWSTIGSSDPTRRTWGLLTFVALLYFASHQIFDFYPNMPAVLFTAAIPLAFLDAFAGDEPSTRPRRFRFSSLPRAVEIGAGAAVVVSIAGLLLQEVPSRSHDQAVESANNGNWAAALAPASTAAQQDPEVSTYQFTAGLAEAWNGNHAAAAKRFKVVAEQDDFPEAWLNLAAQEAELGASDEALASLQSALRLGRQRPAVAMPIGDLALRLGDSDLAVEAFAAALTVTPSLAGDPWWAAQPARREIWPVVLQRAEAAASPGIRWELSLMRGDVSAATSLASSTPDPELANRVVLAWTGDEAALAQLRERCDSMPTEGLQLLWCSRLADRAGDKEAGARYRYLAYVQSYGYRLARELRVDSSPPSAYPILEGSPSTAWGTYTYRRVTPWDVLAPGLIRLGFE